MNPTTMSNYVHEQSWRGTGIATPETFRSFFNFTRCVRILEVVPLAGNSGIYRSNYALLELTAFVAAGKWVEVWLYAIFLATR